MIDTLVTPPSASTVGINQMMGSNQASEVDQLCYFDPKLMNSNIKEWVQIDLFSCYLFSM